MKTANSTNTANIDCDQGVQYAEIPSTGILTIAIIGAGPVGIRCAKEISQKILVPCNINIYGDEPYDPYDRIKLSQLLAQTISYPEIFFNLHDETSGNHYHGANISFINAKITEIDSEKKAIKSAVGEDFSYDRLIIATGSRPFVPNIPGVEREGVFTFRNIRDVEHLLSRVNRSRHIVVVGGGLLGLEAAKGLLQKNTKVTLLHQASHLMNRQLNEDTAEVLRQAVVDQGIGVITNDGLGEIKGNGRVSSIVTRKRQIIDCDTVVFCTGITPNIELARSAGIRFSRGIVVDQQLKTSVDNIYAIGECAEFNGNVYGLVAPGLEQASVLAENLAGGEANFLGTDPYTKLKVMNVAVSSIGEVVNLPRRPLLKTIIYRKRNRQKNSQQSKESEKKTSIQRSIVVEKGRLIGACSVGEWQEIHRLRESFVQKRYFFPWQLLLFRFTGRLWFFDEKQDVTAWPEQAIICQCNAVSRQTIDLVICEGNKTIAAVTDNCGAGGVCGSCQPLIQELIDAHVSVDPASNDETPQSSAPPVTWSPALLSGCVIALLLAFAVFFFPGISTPTSVQTETFSWLWTDKFYKQVTGFSLLSITLIGLLLSLRKRLRWEFLGAFTRYRLVHVFLGVVALAVLFVHTGAHLGENLNRWLMINYLSAAAIGALAGIAIAVSRNSVMEINIRKASFWLHLFVVWPLPVLVTAHIISSYYF